ncbi:hypothetical protein GGX14DRAFT_561577 [Mycena pura]|uniref:Retrotransposon gag domain-containing protein n=1 Tax=Mycena pura TaxID=153505 RepID=A0AAD6YEI9_9AGAR|nr:hypothetical protein GGX14DRAFT_561577 [Mycena pura]
MSARPSDIPEGYAWVEKHPNKLPALHPGKLTPFAIDNLKLAATNYFNAKGTNPDKQVGVIFGCFLDQKFTNWVRPANKCKELLAMTLADFMKAFRAKFLEDDWTTVVRTEILRMRQKPTQSFDKIATALLGHCSLLADTAPLSDTQVEHQLDAGMTDDLQLMCLRDDKERKHNLDTFRRLANMADANKENKRKPGDDAEERTAKRHKGKPTSASSTGADNRNPYPPPLTQAERELLAANEGCNKYRKLFAGHHHRNCPSPMTRANHTIVTEQTIADACRQRKGKSSVTTPTAPTASSSKTVAAVMPPIVSDSEDKNDSCDDDNNLSHTDVSRSPYLRPPPSHSSRHLLWRCLVDGPNLSFPVTIEALIDNGAFLVMIDEVLVAKLGLRCFDLHAPQEISPAFSDPSCTSLTSLTQYVKLHVTSPDQSWTSNTVHALIAPNLSAQAPKLKLKDKLKKTNADYKTMMNELNAVCESRRAYLEERNLFEKVKPADVIAAVRERVEILAHWDELNKKAEALKKEYATIFEPVPHLDLLPTDPT